MELLSSDDLKYWYNKFYIEMRRYMWDISVVELLVDFETAVYQAVPDMDQIKDRWVKLRQAISPAFKDDEGFRLKAEKIDSLLAENDDIYCKLYLTKEVPTA